MSKDNPENFTRESEPVKENANSLQAFEWLLEYHLRPQPYRVKYNDKFCKQRDIVRAALTSRSVDVEKLKREATCFAVRCASPHETHKSEKFLHDFIDRLISQNIIKEK